VSYLSEEEIERLFSVIDFGITIQN